MTTDTLVEAAKVVLQRYGLADEQELFNLLPSVIEKFLESNVWNYFIKGPSLVSKVAGQDYLSLPNDFFLVDTLWSETLGRTLDAKTHKTWSRYRASNPTASGSPVIYTQIGNRVYPFPPPGTGENFYILYYPKLLNTPLESIPFGHFAIKDMLVAEWLPVGDPNSAQANTKAFYLKVADKSLDQAIATENARPDTQEDEQLEVMQQVLNQEKVAGFAPRSPFTR